MEEYKKKYLEYLSKQGGRVFVRLGPVEEAYMIAVKLNGDKEILKRSKLFHSRRIFEPVAALINNRGVEEVIYGVLITDTMLQVGDRTRKEDD